MLTVPRIFGRIFLEHLARKIHVDSIELILPVGLKEP